MAGRVREDPPPARVDVQQRGPEAEDLFLGRVEVRDIEVEVDLLRVLTVGPARRPVVGHPLEAEHQTGTLRQTCPGVAAPGSGHKQARAA